MLRLPVGYDIFREIIDNEFYFIDKTEFILDIFKDESKVILITRPRRFGKTLTLSMLHHFLAAEVFGQKTEGLFKGFKITTIEEGRYLKQQGKYPVIFVTFKDVKDGKFEHAYDQILELMIRVHDEHSYLLTSDRISPNNKRLFQLMMDRNVTEAQLRDSLLNLTECLFKHHGTKPWLLIDEYDTPIQSAYVHGYYDEMMDFMRGLFGSALKNNPYLNKAVITGILRVSKESLFSGLNNIKVYSVLQKDYSQYFGFTEAEVNDILQKSDLEHKAEEIKSWYNGYQFGETVVYNPWSIVNCVKEKGLLQPYWINTSDNALVRDLVIKSSVDLKEHFEHLLQKIPIQVLLNEYVTFGDLNTNRSAVWGLLLSAGYINAIGWMRNEEGLMATLVIPNREVYSLYRSLIKQWLAKDQDVSWYNRFLENLLQGKIEAFGENLKDVMDQVVSVHDVAKEPEAFYHGLMLGLTASLDPSHYELKSNKESGAGRYDILIIPVGAVIHASAAISASAVIPAQAGIQKNNLDAGDGRTDQRPAILLELKSVRSKTSLAKEAEKALQQIIEREYESELKQRGLSRVVKIGLAFRGKEFRITGC